MLAGTMRRAASAMGMPTPVAYKLRRGAAPGLLARGMNFAVGGAGVVAGTSEAPKLGRQVDKFKRMVRHGIIDDDLTDSVALIAFSGRRDYERFNDMTNTDVKAVVQEVTDKIADAVEQLMDLGVEKVVVTTLPPIGCTPGLSRRPRTASTMPSVTARRSPASTTRTSKRRCSSTRTSSTWT